MYGHIFSKADSTFEKSYFDMTVELYGQTEAGWFDPSQWANHNEVYDSF